MTPTVSLIIPTFNRAHLLAEAVDSALAQTLERVEVIVVDDGSTDETPQVLKRYGNRIRTIRQPNRGLPAARNAGMDAARGTYIAFLDDDDLLRATKITEQVAVLEGNCQLGWTYCDVLMRNEVTGEVVKISERFVYRQRRLNGWLFPELIHGDFMPSMAPLIRRSALDAAGRFDEQLTALEDWDLWLRLALVAEARYLPSVLATYRVHKAGMSQDRARMDRNRFQVLDKVRRANPQAVRSLGIRGRRIMAEVHNWFGYAAYTQGAWPEATRRLAASIRTLPWQGRATLVFARCLIRRWLR